MTEPTALAQLRHLYQNMANGAVRDTASAKRIAEGLLAPAIEALERATPQPTQAQAGAVPLTHDEALDAFCHTPGINQFVQAFMAGVRFAEQHHGIKGGQHGAE